MIAEITSPAGRLWIKGTARDVALISFVALGTDDHHGVLDWIVRPLHDYFAGSRAAFPGGPELRGKGVVWALKPAAPPRNPSTIQLIWQAMCTIPYGQTVGYAELGLLTGGRDLARVAGQACRKNPLPILIPCHRVVAAKGLGGYTPGLAIKRTLLMLEGVTLYGGLSASEQV